MGALRVVQCIKFKVIIAYFPFQGSSIPSETAAKNYTGYDVFGLQKPRIPAKRLGTAAEVRLYSLSFIWAASSEKVPNGT